MHQQPLHQFMEVGHIADIMLDTSPISGGTTTLHSLWMGMPVITLDAERGVDACSAYVLRELGMEEDIAQTEEEYVQIAMRVMADPQRLSVQRENIRARMSSSIFMDYAAYAADVEKSFRIMWLNWLRGGKRDLCLDVDVEAEMVLFESSTV